MSDEQRLKISQAHKGKKKPWSGKYMTTEHRKSISERMLGNKLCLGRKLSDEVKEKIRVSNLGKVHNISDEGMERMRKKNYVVWNKGIKKQKEIKIPKVPGRKKGSIAWNRGMLGYNSGEKNPKWIKDRSKLAKRQERNDSAYAEWRKCVRDRDSWTCKVGEGCEGKVIAHHIYPWKKYPEFRYTVSNGITLCTKHHPRTREKENEMIGYFLSLLS